VGESGTHDFPIWQEALFGIEILLLHANPIYYGFGVPRIGLNADCPNLLIRNRLTATLDKARKETGRKIHLLGHSLGGLPARATATERPGQIASVITLGSPFRGAVVHPSVKRAIESVRQGILLKHGNNVLPGCYTGQCSCSFLASLRRDLPAGVAETAIYSRTDGIVNCRYCVTGSPECDFEVTGTHIGLVFNPPVYRLIAGRLAEVRSPFGPIEKRAPAQLR
jgi:triacylglycerol lipase